MCWCFSNKSIAQINEACIFYPWAVVLKLQIKKNKLKETEPKASKLEGIFCNLTKKNNKLYIFLVNKEEP